VADITSSVADPPGQSPNQGASSSSKVLFGSDLSQLDKDLIFEGLKKLYKKKVRRGSQIDSGRFGEKDDEGGSGGDEREGVRKFRQCER
jgi:hypothetical protein